MYGTTEHTYVTNRTTVTPGGRGTDATHTDGQYDCVIRSLTKEMENQPAMR